MWHSIRWSRCAITVAIAWGIQLCNGAARGQIAADTLPYSGNPAVGRPGQTAPGTNVFVYPGFSATSRAKSRAVQLASQEGVVVGDDEISSGCNGPSCDYCPGSCECTLPPCDCQPPCCPCPPAPRFTVFADYLFLQPTDADVTHAQQQNGIGGAGTVPFGDIGTIDMDFDSGIRLGGAYHCGPCSSVLLSYTFFETDASDSVAAPEIPGGGGAVGSLVHHPGASITASDGPVDATYDIQFQVADTLYRQQWLHGNNYTINFLVGAQYGHLEQDFAQAGIFSGGNAGAIDTTSSIRFDGGGLKAGFDTERQLGHGFALYGRCAAAAMQGKFRAQYSLNNATTESLLAAANWSDNRIVPQLEYEAGIGWQSAGGRLQLSAGYMMSRWLNTVTTSEFIDAVERDNYVNVGDTLSFAGLVASLGCSW